MWKLIVLLFFPGIALAAPPEPILACDKAEPPVICALKVQRNNVLDELAISEGKRMTEAIHRAVLEDWWKSYVAGVEEKERKMHNQMKLGSRSEAHD